MSGNPENTPLIKRYLAETLADVAEDPLLRERTLALALYWSSYARLVRSVTDVDPVQEQVTTVELARAVAPQVHLAAADTSWVAAYQVEDGKMRLAEFFDRFGPSALYDCDFGGDIVDPPLAWKFIRWSTREEWWNNPKGRSIEPSLSGDLLSHLLRHDPPWLEASERYTPIVSVVMEPVYRQSVRPTDLATALLLALPLCELQIAGFSRTDRSKSSDRPTRRAEFIARIAFDRNQLAGRPNTHPADRWNQAPLDIDDRVRRVISHWLRLETSYIRQ
jgi:hypothetical protein